DDQYLLGTSMASTGNASSAIPQCLDDRHPGGAQRWHDAEDQRADRRDAEREEKHRNAHTDFGEPRNSFGRERKQCASAPRRESKADDARDDAEDDAFGDQLRNDACAPRAECAADGNLTLAGRSASSVQSAGPGKRRLRSAVTIPRFACSSLMPAPDFSRAMPQV